MNAIAEIVVRAALAAAVLAGLPGAAAAGPAADAQAMPGQSGPWAFDRQTGPGEATIDMATTPAAEDANVWLVLVCDGSHLAAALMHATGFVYAVAPESGIVVRFAGHPVVAADVLPVGENQLSIADATARRLLPLIIDSDRAVVSISDSDGAARTTRGRAGRRTAGP